MRRAIGLLSAAGVVVLAAAGCSGGRPSSEAFTERVAEICQAAGERHEQAAAGFDFEAFDPETSDLTAIVALIEENVAIGRETARELDKVRGPEADEARVALWIDVNNRIADNADGMVAAARAGDRAEFMRRADAEERIHGEAPDDPMFEGC